MKKLALFLGMGATLLAHKAQAQSDYIESALLRGNPHESHICVGFLDNKQDSVILSLDYKFDSKIGKKIPVKAATYRPGNNTPELETNGLISSIVTQDTNGVLASMYGEEKKRYFIVYCPKYHP